MAGRNDDASKNYKQPKESSGRLLVDEISPFSDPLFLVYPKQRLLEKRHMYQV